MLRATGHPSEIPGILPAISAGNRGTVLVVKSVWLVMNCLLDHLQSSQVVERSVSYLLERRQLRFNFNDCTNEIFEEPEAENVEDDDDDEED